MQGCAAKKVAEVVQASAQFEQSLFADKICHAEQPALEQAVSNCEHRAIGSGRFWLQLYYGGR